MVQSKRAALSKIKKFCGDLIRILDKRWLERHELFRRWQAKEKAFQEQSPEYQFLLAADSHIAKLQKSLMNCS